MTRLFRIACSLLPLGLVEAWKTRGSLLLLNFRLLGKGIVMVILVIQLFRVSGRPPWHVYISYSILIFASLRVLVITYIIFKSHEHESSIAEAAICIF